jgi:hypothetical protein
VQLIVVSPMRRAIQTCLIGLDWLIDSGVPILPDARWQGAFQCSVLSRLPLPFSFTCLAS